MSLQIDKRIYSVELQKHGRLVLALVAVLLVFALIYLLVSLIMWLKLMII